MKPYLIINIVDGRLGVIYERPTWKEAVDLAVQLALEQSDENIALIRDEIERDTNWESLDGDISVAIAQSEE